MGAFVVSGNGPATTPVAFGSSVTTMGGAGVSSVPAPTTYVAPRGRLYDRS